MLVREKGRKRPTNVERLTRERALGGEYIEVRRKQEEGEKEKARV